MAVENIVDSVDHDFQIEDLSLKSGSHFSGLNLMNFIEIPVFDG